MRTRHALLTAVAIGAVALTAGCGPTRVIGVAGPLTPASPSVAPSPADGPTTPADGPTTPADGPTTHTSTPAGTPTTAHNPPKITECDRAAGLDITPGATDASSGHRRIVVVFTNTSARTCFLVGYPGVDAVDAGGHSRAHAVRTLNGYEGGLPAGHTPQPVTLSPGESASAVVEALATTVDGGTCTPYAGLLVTAPDDTRSVTVPWAETDACSGLQVHPVVAGSEG